MFDEYKDLLGGEENRHPKINLISLYRLSEIERRSFIERLSKTNGTCQAWIHTHHRENEEVIIKNGHSRVGVIEEKRKLDIVVYRKKRSIMIKKTVSSNMPIIAFIPFDGNDSNLQEQLEKYKKYYEAEIDNSNQPNDIYYVPTFENDALPCTSEMSRRQNRDFGLPTEGETITEEWNSLSKILKNLHVNKLIMSGAFYEKGADSLTGNLPRGCVNEAEQKLKKLGFQVIVTNIVSPHPDR